MSLTTTAIVPNLYDAFNATPIDSAPETMTDGPQDVDSMDAPHLLPLFSLWRLLPGD
jgi:hypothetical protein